MENNKNHSSSYKGSKTAVANYRPVSNLPSMGKVYAKCILQWVKAFTCNIDDTNENQHGFKPAAVSIQNRIAKALEIKNNVLVVTLDLRVQRLLL